jgi:hypothetical protein
MFRKRQTMTSEQIAVIPDLLKGKWTGLYFSYRVSAYINLAQIV